MQPLWTHILFMPQNVSHLCTLAKKLLHTQRFFWYSKFLTKLGRKALFLQIALKLKCRCCRLSHDSAIQKMTYARIILLMSTMKSQIEWIMLAEKERSIKIKCTLRYKIYIKCRLNSNFLSNVHFYAWIYKVITSKPLHQHFMPLINLKSWS